MDNKEFVKQENDFWEEMKQKVIAYYDKQIQEIENEYKKANDPFLGHINIVNLEKCREKIAKIKNRLSQC